MSQKILIINSSNKFWGAEVSLSIFLRELGETEFELILRNDGSGFSSILDEYSIRYEIIDLELSPKRIAFFYSLLRVLKFLITHRVNTIYANNEDISSLLSIIRVLTLFFIKTKLHIRNTPSNYDYYKKLMFLHNDIICNSNFTKNSLLPNSPIVNKKAIHVVPNSHGQSKEVSLNNKNSKDYFLTVGRISEDKGQYDVVQAICSMTDMPHLKYHMYGMEQYQNAYLDKINEYIKVNSDEERIKSFPFQKDLRFVYQNAIATILPTYFETFGRIVIESGYYGTPVIVRNIESLTEIVEDGIDGLVWDGTPEHLKLLLCKVTQDKEFTRRLGLNLNKKVLDQYDDQTYCKSLKEIIFKEKI